MVHRPKQGDIVEKPNGSIDTFTMADTEKTPKISPKSDGWKVANLKYKTRRSDPIKLAILKFTGRFTCLSVFIYEFCPNQTDKYIKMTLDIEEYAGGPMLLRA